MFSGLQILAQERDPVREGPSPIEPRSVRIGEQIEDLMVTLLDGTKHPLSSLAAGRPLVLAIRDVGCPLSKKYGPRLARMERDFAARGVALLLVNTNELETLEVMRREIATYGFSSPYAHDPTGTLGRALHVNRTTDVFLLDASRTLRYRGAIDDQYGIAYVLPAPRRKYLLEAIEAVLAGRPVTVPATTAPGCVLDFSAAPKSNSAPTYHRTVSRILQANCEPCHRPGQSAPFTLMNFAEVKAKRGMIRRVVKNRTMPPWFADPAVGHWANDRSLSEEERDTILSWARAGYPEGDPAHAPEPRTWPSSEWTIGTPDVIYQLPRAQTIPAEGVIPYRYVQVQTHLTEDRWVRALEIRPTAPEVVHHVLVFLEAPEGTTRHKRRQARNEAQGFFAGMVPGQNHRIYPEGVAKFLPKGSTLRFQVHYTVNGRTTHDQTRLGLVFADKKPRHEVQTYGIANHRFAIPPGASGHRVTSEILLPRNVQIYGFMPHLHVRGMAFRYEVEQRDGSVTPLLSIPRYDFNWQLAYVPESPIHLVRGSTVRAIAWYDNSRGNPANPDPTKTVRWGPQTWHEMMIGYVDYTVLR